MEIYWYRHRRTFRLLVDDGVEQLVVYGAFLACMVYIDQVGSILWDALVGLYVRDNLIIVVQGFGADVMAAYLYGPNPYIHNEEQYPANPHFAEIIDDTIALRNRWCPKAKISVLSNSTFSGKDSVRNALLKVDNNILKLDTVDPDYIRRVDRPTQPTYDVQQIIKNLKWFNGHVIIQTMFMKGDGTDNTGDEYVQPWLDAVKYIAPMEVMVYTIDRETPDQKLLKASHEELNRIKSLVEAAGISCTASY